MPSQPRSDDQIASYTVVEPSWLNGMVSLHGYDPEWPRCYDEEAAGIRAVLGADAVYTAHIGSTSVPGLAAKPVIDVALLVADAADEPSYLPALERLGYSLRVREPEWHEHRCLHKRRDAGGDRDVNLHVFTEGCVVPRRDIAFRDRLRADAADRELYERTKRQLAARVWRHMQHYADAKTDVINDILRRAGDPGGRCANC